MARDLKFGSGPAPQQAIEKKAAYFTDVVTPTLPTAASATVMSVQTAVVGSNFAAFGSQVCDALDIVNRTGTTIEYKRGSASVYMPVRDGESRLVVGIANASEISVRRADQLNTQVTVAAEAFVA